MERKIRVLVAKPGLDGHDVGAKVVTQALRDAGMEVIYTGMRQTPQQIAQAALQEDVDVVGLSILSGAHLSLTQKVMRALREAGAGDRVVVVGGVIPTQEDIDQLKSLGVAEVFPADTPLRAIAEFIERAVAAKGSAPGPKTNAGGSIGTTFGWG